MDFNLRFWAIQTVAMMLTAFLLPGLRVSGPIPAFATVAVLAFVNAHLWDAALFFQVPREFGQPQLVLLAANAIIFWIIVKVLPGIEIRGVLPAIVAPIVFTVTSIAISKYEPMIDWDKVYSTSVGFLTDVKSTVDEVKVSAGSSSRSGASSAPGQGVVRGE